MELRKPEITELSKYVDAWIAHPENELEATFGARGTVDSTTFLAIAQRLQRKGYAAMPQEDRLSILTYGCPCRGSESSSRTAGTTF